MPILYAFGPPTGLAGVNPNEVFIQTNDTLATVTTAGYLTHAVKEGILTINNDTMAMITTSQGTLWLACSITGLAPNLVYSLIAPIQAGGQIFAGNVQAGSNGVAGHFISFPPGATTGTLSFTAANQGGNFNSSVTNAAFGQATTMTIPDPGNAAGQFLVGATATPFVNNHLVVASGTTGLMADAGYQFKTVAAAVVAGGAAAQTINDAFCTAGSNVLGNWNTQANAVTVQKIVPGNGSFIVTSSGDPGASTFNYIITKV